MTTKNNKQQKQSQAGPVAQHSRTNNTSQPHAGLNQPQNNQLEDVIKHLKENGYKVTEEYSTTGRSKVSGESPQRKTWWDWGQLLIIPLLIALLGIGFTWVQNQTSLQIAKDTRDQDLQAAKDTQEEATLKAYLDDMTTLLLDKKLGSQSVIDKNASTEAAIIARAKTLTTLPQLSPERKGILLKFLYEAKLIQKTNPVINLEGADISNVPLDKVNLSGANLEGTLLENAHFFFANLNDVDLSGANLQGADLTDAFVNRANLGTLTLYQTGGLSRVVSTILNGAYLNNAELSNANLNQADLRNTQLDKTNLNGTDLSDADLSGALSTTPEQLAQAKSLQGAIMPDGSIHP